MQLKKLFAAALVPVLALSLTACGKTGSDKGAASAKKALNVMVEVEVESLDPQVATDGTSFEVIADYTDGLKQMDST